MRVRRSRDGNACSRSFIPLNVHTFSPHGRPYHVCPHRQYLQDASDSFYRCGCQVSAIWVGGSHRFLRLHGDGTLGPSTQLGLLAAGWRGWGLVLPHDVVVHVREWWESGRQACGRDRERVHDVTLSLHVLTKLPPLHLIQEFEPTSRHCRGCRHKNRGSGQPSGHHHCRHR